MRFTNRGYKSVGDRQNVFNYVYVCVKQTDREL